MTDDKRIDEKKLIEAIKISTSLSKIKEEYNTKSSQLRLLQEQIDYFYPRNKFLINKNLELQDEFNLTQNKIKEYITDLLRQKEPYIRATVVKILNIIKEDPEKEILINNNNNNLHSSDQKISEIVAKVKDTISEIIVNSLINSNSRNYDVYNSQEKI